MKAFIYEYKKGRCKHCDRVGPPNSASGTNHLHFDDVNIHLESNNTCTNVLTEQNFNLVWDSEEVDGPRSLLAGHPVFDMKCNRCLKFIGAYQHPWECKVNYCENCGNKIKRD